MAPAGCYGAARSRPGSPSAWSAIRRSGLTQTVTVASPLLAAMPYRAWK